MRSVQLNGRVLFTLKQKSADVTGLFRAITMYCDRVFIVVFTYVVCISVDGMVTQAQLGR